MSEAMISEVEYLSGEVARLNREVERLRAGGCARDQRATQFCVEVAERDAEIRDLRREVQSRIDHGNALYLTIVQRLTPYFPPGDRGLDWDVLPGTLEGLAQERDRLRADLTAAQEKLRAADAVLARLAGWCLTYGASLCPRSGDADTFGDGVRAMKEQVAGILHSSFAVREKA